MKQITGWILLALVCGTFGVAAGLPSGDGGSLRPVALKPLKGVRRVLFLGDSITYAGGYIEAIDAYLYLHDPDHRVELIDAGLPSETVSGLTEPNHAGGAFPRPDLHERLERALSKVKPDLVVACYGMNDGIYHPFEAGRFAKYQEGITRLQEAVKKAGAKLWLLTPPPFDALPLAGQTLPDGQASYPSGQPFAGYDGVLDRYSAWLLSQKKRGWSVTDVHTPLNTYLAEKRKTVPDFVFAGDGVHLDEKGHAQFARAVLRGWGAPEDTLPDPDRAESGSDPKVDVLKRIVPLIHQRQRLLTDAWLNEIGHKRPGMAAGVPVAEAEEKAKTLDEQIRALVRGQK